MFASIKLRTIAIIAAALILIAGICGAITITAASSGVPDNGKIVVLDAGHGGIDGGVVGGTTGTKEADINLAVTKAVKEYLVTAGYRVVLTRKNSEGLYSSSDGNKKLSDMAKRRGIIHDAKPDMVVSIHQNFYPLQSVRGAQVFYTKGSETSLEYANSMQKMLNSGSNGRRVAMTGDYYILQCSEYPSVLVECGFLSCPEEERLLVTSGYQQKIAYLIFSAIHGSLMDGKTNEDIL